MQRTHRSIFPQLRPLFGPLAVLMILLMLGVAAIVTGSRASAQPLSSTAPLATNHPVQRQIEDGHTPLERLQALANEWALTWSIAPSPTLYLPIITNIFTQTESLSLAERMGFGLTSAALAPYTDVTTLGAGWYLDWRVRETPEQPADMEYVQMVRIHQELSCGEWYHGDRGACPYTTPYNYRYRPDRGAIEAAAIANPGSLWLIGNEMDRKD
ncbi:MAG: hypothetical protein KDE31_38030, partial [Caldilineaceae bacterium]|nr:hypothetical protein [Caldilineaceae bacterium]